MSNFEKWDYLYGKNPVAETLSQSLVNLPTHMLRRLRRGDLRGLA